MSRWTLLAMALSACGGEPAAPETPGDVREDVRRLQEAMTEDLELLALEDVDQALADDLPVRAGELLEAGALPAARRHATQIEALEARTPEGQRLRDEAAGLLQARAQALADYREVLRRGLVEDLALLQSIQAQREAEEAIDAFLGRLEGLRPLPTKGRSKRRSAGGAP